MRRSSTASWAASSGSCALPLPRPDERLRAPGLAPRRIFRRGRRGSLLRNQQQRVEVGAAALAHDPAAVVDRLRLAVVPRRAGELVDGDGLALLHEESVDALAAAEDLALVVDADRARVAVGAGNLAHRAVVHIGLRA